MTAWRRAFVLLVAVAAAGGCTGDSPPATPATPTAPSTPPGASPTATPTDPGPVSPTAAAPTPTEASSTGPGSTPTEGLPATPSRPGSTPTDAPTPTIPLPTLDAAQRCAPADPQALSLEALADRFDAEVFPLMTRQAGGCTACHYAESGRLMTMGPTGSDTFYRLRAGGFLNGDAPGTMLARVRATDASAMPLGGPHWTVDEVSRLTCVVEDLLMFEASGVLAADEEFPPWLLEPWTGPAFEDFDDTWLGFDALKGRIAVQFVDDWVRDGVDNFAVNIALFGGVDFETTFQPVRQPTADYLLGMDLLAWDVCSQAADDLTGPFQDLPLDDPILEEPPSQTRVLDTADLDAPTAGTVGTDSTGEDYSLIWSNGYVGAEVAFPIDGDYTFTIWAKGDLAGLELPHMEIRIDNETVAGFDLPLTLSWASYTATVPVKQGDSYVAVWFTNDYYAAGGDRNLRVESMQIDGPVSGTTPGAIGARDDAKLLLSELMERVLYRPAVITEAEDERDPLYELLLEMETLEGDRRHAWAGVCALLLKHPDFLYTRPPYFDQATPAEQERLLVLRTALDLLSRPPTADEWARFDDGESRMDLVEEWLESEELLDTYFARARILFESNGTTSADEPARLFTWLFLNDAPIKELLTAEYTINPQMQMRARPDEHGPTGALTMPGYIQTKAGYPHFNYSARVLGDFMGYIFEVPPEIVDSRAGATAASTVDPNSVCYSCHQLLTPLAYQRLRWADDGTYRDVDEEGEPIDDSDRGVVETYPYKGSGMAAFSAQAVRKEMFIRRMVNTQAEMLLGRPLRWDEDERDLYHTLWETADLGEGTFRDILTIILTSEAYTHPAGGRYEEGE